MGLLGDFAKGFLVMTAAIWILNINACCIGANMDGTAVSSGSTDSHFDDSL